MIVYEVEWLVADSPQKLRTFDDPAAARPPLKLRRSRRQLVIKDCVVSVLETGQYYDLATIAAATWERSHRQ